MGSVQSDVCINPDMCLPYMFFSSNVIQFLAMSLRRSISASLLSGTRS